MISKQQSHESDDSHLVWEDQGSEVLYRTPIFELKAVQRKSPDGRQAPFVSVDAPDWVLVVAEVDHPGEEPGFLIVRQYRHGCGRVALEFPAGVVDPGETPLQAARRELLEETGFEPGSLMEIGAVNPNPAFMTNTSYTYLASNLRKVSDTLNLDENELLDVHELRFSELRSRIGRKPMDNAMTAQAWYFYLAARDRIR